MKIPVIEYDGGHPPLSVVLMDIKKGIVLFRNYTNCDADGELYVDHLGMETGIQPGLKIAIKRIDKRNWQPDRFYVIIDTSDQIMINELVPGNDDDSVRVVSPKSPAGPHKLVKLESIEVLFRIVNGNYIPAPRRNINQQKKRPPDDGKANSD